MLYYTHVNEDNRIERQLLQQHGCTTAVAVTGSGERVLALMDAESIKKIIAVDLNKEAIFLLQLKIAVLTSLSTEQYFKFTGHHIGDKNFRRACFEKIKPHLNEDCSIYWGKRIKDIEKGIINAGHFEKFLTRIRPVLHLFLGKNFLSAFNSRSSFFLKLKWKILSCFFSQTWIYSMLGNKDPAFIGKAVQSRYIPEALDNMIRNGNAYSSFIAHLIFKGHLRNMENEDIPPSFNENTIDKIRERLLKRSLIIEYYTGDLLTFIKQTTLPADLRVFYSVSDILSFEDQDYLSALLEKITAKGGNTIVWRSFLSNRLTKQQQDNLSSKYKEVLQHDKDESSGMYQVFSVTNNKINKLTIPAP